MSDTTPAGPDELWSRIVTYRISANTLQQRQWMSDVSHSVVNKDANLAGFALTKAFASDPTLLPVAPSIDAAAYMALVDAARADAPRGSWLRWALNRARQHNDERVPQHTAFDYVEAWTETRLETIRNNLVRHAAAVGPALRQVRINSNSALAGLLLLQHATTAGNDDRVHTIAAASLSMP
jgi:hypothetical protein